MVLLLLLSSHVHIVCNVRTELIRNVNHTTNEEMMMNIKYKSIDFHWTCSITIDMNLNMLFFLSLSLSLSKSFECFEIMNKRKEKKESAAEILLRMAKHGNGKRMNSKFHSSWIEYISEYLKEPTIHWIQMIVRMQCSYWIHSKKKLCKAAQSIYSNKKNNTLARGICPRLQNYLVWWCEYFTAIKFWQAQSKRN